MKFRALLLGVIAFAASVAVPASAASDVEVDTSACSGFTVSASCRFTGNINTNTNGNSSYLLAQAAYNVLFDPNIVLTPLGDTDGGLGSLGTFTGAGTTSGTWSLPGYDVRYVAVKTSNGFVLYSTAGSSGSWDTFGNVGNKQGKAQALSHLVFFGDLAVPGVPEPSAWALMILGLGAAGAAMRRRQLRVRFA